MLEPCSQQQAAESPHMPEQSESCLHDPLAIMLSLPPLLPLPALPPLLDVPLPVFAEASGLALLGVLAACSKGSEFPLLEDPHAMSVKAPT